MIKSYKLYLYSLLSGILFALGWPEIGGFTPLLFVAFVPLLFVEAEISSNSFPDKPQGIFKYAYLAFFTFNILTTWWIYFASAGGMAGAVIFNSLFMSIVFVFFSTAKKHLGARMGYACFIIFWLAFEYLHLNWELSWPWLTLGNGLASAISAIQWYEFTGVFGGSLWILAGNVFFFKLLVAIAKKQTKDHLKYYVAGAIALLLPFIISLSVYYTYAEEENPVNITVVQPNVDPYYEKFDGLPSEEQLDKMLQMAETKITPATDFVVFPETAIPRNIWENELEEDIHLLKIRSFLTRHPELNYVTGLSSNKAYLEGEEKPFTARNRGDYYYDSYNTAMQLSHNSPSQLYHKSKLVIGVETTPYPAFFGFFERFAIDLGGITGSLGFDKERSVFYTPDSSTVIAPVVCYESIYGDYVGEYIRKGAQLIFVITNDGWWSDTPGYKQHLSMSQMRAIEMRKSVARSANTGISCFINQRGDVIKPTPWWQEAVIEDTINKNNKITFYARFGDYIGRFAAFLAVLLLMWTLIVRFRNRNKFKSAH